MMWPEENAACQERAGGRAGGGGGSFKTQFEIKKVTIIYGSPGNEALNFIFVAVWGDCRENIAE